MKKLLIAAAAGAVLCTGTPALADDHAAPEMRQVAWYEVMLIKWKEGKGGRAHEIIQLFEATDKALGREGVIDLHMGTGEWDSIVAMPMLNGPAAIAWQTNPADEEWNAKFIELNGGEEAAMKLWSEFNDCILEQQRQIGHIDIDE
ncbi:hypothetical protein [Altererythrobacter sp. MF3-039]|uniref:hypothetical protein n=1 Tax=Altererythrobacter sp. MF3-039 TaxID=3252901 RepID=UPI00390CCDF6